MNKALISIGSNEDRDTNIALCRQLLDAAFGGVGYSKTSITAPYGNVYKADFLNQLAVVTTGKTEDEVLAMLKEMEQELGRSKNDKTSGKVVIDIDLVIWNDKVRKPEDLRRRYVAELLESF